MKNKQAIIIIGMPGSGKTSISKMLIDRLPFFYCSSDLIRSKLFEEERITEDRDYTPQELSIIYNAIYYISEIQSDNAHDLLIEGVYRSRELRNHLCYMLIEKGYTLNKFYITCNDSIAISRTTKRKKEGTSSPAGANGYLEIKSKFESPLDDEGFCTIDNSRNITDTVALVCKYLKKKGVM